MSSHSQAQQALASDAPLPTQYDLTMRFRDELAAMLDEITRDAVPPRGSRRGGIGRVIADSWPFDSPLGAIILRAEQA